MVDKASEERVREALSQVIDPETGLNVMRMDIIHDLEVKTGGEVTLTFRPSSPVCPLAYTLANEIRKKVAGLDWVRSVKIAVENFQHARHLESIVNP